MEKIRAIALVNRSLIFARLLSAPPFQDAMYAGRVLARHAVAAGYCEARKALKGNTLVEWSKLIPPVGEGSGTPTRWACMAAIDLLFEHVGTPETSDTTFLCCWAFYRRLSLGDAESVVNEFPLEHHNAVRGLFGA